MPAVAEHLDAEMRAHVGKVALVGWQERPATRKMPFALAGERSQASNLLERAIRLMLGVRSPQLADGH